MASVSSWWLGQALRSGGAGLIRRCYFTDDAGGVFDLSHRVLQWPTISYAAGRLAAHKVDVELAGYTPRSTDHYFLQMQLTSNSWMKLFHTDSRLTLELGFTHPQSGQEYLTLFNGRVSACDYSKGRIQLSARGVDNRLEDTMLGTEGNPMLIGCQSNSAYWLSPHSVAWTVCASCGLDTTTGTANPDIDWTAWVAWLGTFSAHYQNTSVVAVLTGQNGASVLAEIAKQTHSVIGFDMLGRLTVARRNGPPRSGSPVVGFDHILDLRYKADRERSNNYLTIMGHYLPGSGGIGGTWHGGSDINQFNTFMGPTYGYRHDRWQSEHFFFCVNTAAHVQAHQYLGISSTSMPASQKRFFPAVRLSLPLAGVILELGGGMRIVDSWMGVDSGTEWLVTGKTISMETGRVDLDGEERQEWRGYYPVGKL